MFNRFKTADNQRLEITKNDLNRLAKDFQEYQRMIEDDIEELCFEDDYLKDTLLRYNVREKMDRQKWEDLWSEIHWDKYGRILLSLSESNPLLATENIPTLYYERLQNYKKQYFHFWGLKTIAENLKTDVSKVKIQNNASINLDNITSNQAICLMLGMLSDRVRIILKLYSEGNLSELLSALLTDDERDVFNAKYLSKNSNIIGDKKYLFESSINTQEFLKWAVDEGFLINLGVKKLKPAVAEKLHELLTSGEFITGDFNGIWQWTGQRNQLSYLAKQLKNKTLLGDDCHKELSVYIKDKNPESQKPLKNFKDPAKKNKTLIDEIVKTVALKK